MWFHFIGKQLDGIGCDVVHADKQLVSKELVCWEGLEVLRNELVWLVQVSNILLLASGWACFPTSSGMRL